MPSRFFKEKKRCRKRMPDLEETNRPIRKKIKTELKESLRKDIQKIRQRRAQKKKIESMIVWNTNPTKPKIIKTEKCDIKEEANKQSTKKRTRQNTKEKEPRIPKDKIVKAFENVTSVGDMNFETYVKKSTKLKKMDVYESSIKSEPGNSIEKRQSLESFITRFYPSTHTTLPMVGLNVIKSMNNSIEKKKACPKVGKKKEDDILLEEFINKNDIKSIAFGLKTTQYDLFMKIINEEKEKEDNYIDLGRNYLKRKEFEIPEIEECSKDYCTDFLREASPKSDLERPCRSGNSCICMILALQAPDTAEDIKPEDAFIAREFLIPSVRDKVIRTGELPDIIELCLVCIRFKTTYRYYRCIHSSLEPKELLQNHYNTVNTTGGYILDQCLYPNPKTGKRYGIDRPIVAFKATNYIYASKEDPYDHAYMLKCLCETNLDF